MTKKDFSTHAQRHDPYGWMRDENWQDVIDGQSPLRQDIHDHIVEENDLTAAYMADTEELQDTITKEIISRISEDDVSVPALHDDGFYYYTRVEKGRDYPVYCRNGDGIAKKTGEAYFDVNDWVKQNGYSFYKHGLSISPDGTKAAIMEDTNGSETYGVRIVDMASGTTLETLDINCDRNFTWLNDSQSFLYGCRNLKLKRTEAIAKHVLATPTEQDEIVFKNPYLEAGWHVGMGKTASKRFVCISVSEQGSNVVYILDQENDLASQLVAEAETGIEYSVEHDGKDHFYVHTNQGGATNFCVKRTTVTDVLTGKGSKAWEAYIPHQDGRYVSGIDVNATHLLITASERNVDQQDRLFFAPHGDTSMQEIPVEGMGQVYDVAGYMSGPFTSHDVRVHASSMKHPGLVFDFNLTSENIDIKKEKSFDSFTPDNYIVERKQIKARDGELVPVTVFRRKETPLDGSASLFQYGYGSYGISIDAGFSALAPSYVDRGMIYAIAHIRGGGEKGHSWYLDGKLKNKQNTFNDFIDVTEALIEEGYTSAKKVVAQGASAGGMLMGAIANARPDLYQSILAGVPFVDVLNTICDASLPLTPGEWNEWGNPIEDPEAYARMLSYSPYDNIVSQDYPNMLIESSLTDYRVTYWEPAKWQARLKDHNTAPTHILMKMEMEGGHGGKSGRYDAYKERAFSMAFALKTLP